MIAFEKYQIEEIFEKEILINISFLENKRDLNIFLDQKRFKFKKNKVYFFKKKYQI